MSAPNLFSFATSELSQDAVLAYILSWADKDFAEAPQHRGVHRLGQNLLRQFVAKAAAASQCPDPLTGRTSLRVGVLTQHKRVDVLVKIDGDLALIVEDKTDTGEHGGQIKAYVDAIEEEDQGMEERRQVLAVYVKTGNEAQARAKKSTACGIQMRRDLLAALAEVPDTGDTVIENFRAHLQSLEDDSKSFRDTKTSSWSWHAIEGFYMQLDKELEDPMRNWDHVNPPTGRFLAYWWKVRYTKDWVIYLQLHGDDDHGVKRLTVRSSKRGEGKITKDGQYAILKACRSVAGLPDSGINIKKAGRFRGGDSAAVADITFGTDGGSFLASDPNEYLDLRETMARLKQAMVFVDHVANTIDAPQESTAT